MRLLPTFIAAVGLLAGHVRSQHRNGFGFMDGLAPRSWPLAVAKPPVLGKRDGSCASGQHPCMKSTFAYLLLGFFVCG